MARKEKRSETLSLRINPALKDQLAIAANLLNCSIASVVESVVAEGMSQAKVPFEDIGSAGLISAFQDEGGVPLPYVYKYALHEIPLVMQMRLFYLMPKGLTNKDQVICETIATVPRFQGDDRVFEEDMALKISAPSISIENVAAEMETLESYADYKLHEMQRADGFNLDYESYLKLKKSSETAQGIRPVLQAKKAPPKGSITIPDSLFQMDYERKSKNPFHNLKGLKK